MSFHNYGSSQDSYSIYERFIELPGLCLRCGSRIRLIEARYYCLDPDEGASGGDYSETFLACSRRCGYEKVIRQGMAGGTGGPRRELSSEEKMAEESLWEKPYLPVNPRRR